MLRFRSTVTKIPAKASAMVLLGVVLVATILLPGCARTPEQKYTKFLNNGKAQLDKHDYSRAILEFRNAIQIKPKADEAYYRLALAYLGTRDTRSGTRMLWKAIELNPKNVDAEMKLSELAIATGQKVELEEAEKHIRKLLENSPATADAFNLLAMAEWRLGKKEEAEKLLNQSSAQFPQHLKSAVGLAQIKLANRDVAGAETILKKVVENNPTISDAPVTLGEFYILTGRYGDADQQFRRALEINPKHGFALVSLAGVRWRAGKTAEAEQLYKQAASLPDQRYKPVHAIFLFASG
jgi:Flp pilus assembly protein TadD